MLTAIEDQSHPRNGKGAESYSEKIDLNVVHSDQNVHRASIALLKRESRSNFDCTFVGTALGTSQATPALQAGAQGLAMGTAFQYVMTGIQN